MADSTATSYGDFAKAPKQSNSEAPGWQPVVSTVPGVSLRAYRAVLAAGIMIDPSDSVPMDRGANPAATPTALPEDDPAGP